MCTQSRCIVLAQCHSAAKRRGVLPFGGRFVAEIFVHNCKWRVSQRGADVNYILIQLLLLYLKNLLSYTAWHNYFQAFFCRSNPSQPHIYNACVHNPVVLYLLSVTALQNKTRATSLRRPFCSRNIRPKFNITGVSERGRRKLYFDPTVVTVSQKLAELYSLTSLFSGFCCRIFIMRVYTMPWFCTCSVSQRCKQRRGLLPFCGRFVAEIFVQNFKLRVSQRGADVSYVLIQLLLPYLKNLLSYTAWLHYFQAFFAIQIPPSHIYIKRVYTIPLYCTCSVSQRCKKTRATSLGRPFCSRNIRQQIKMTGVSERGRRKPYFDPTFVTVSQELAELYSLT